MHILTWNVRGLNTPNKQRLLKYCNTNTKADIIILQETKLNSEEMNKFKRSFGWREIKDSPTKGTSGGLAIIWDPRNVSISSIEIHKNCMSGMVKGIRSEFCYRLFNVYGPIHNGDKVRLWKELEDKPTLE